MLEFTAHEIRLGPRFYILLPKLNRQQMRSLAGRLERQGFAITGDSSITAKGHDQTLHLNPSGLCWSISDPADLVLPRIPELLAAPKEPVPLDELKRRYFTLKTKGSGAMVRFEPRMEGGSLWKQLRATGQCCLTPDEGVVLHFLLESANGKCDLLTDFPTQSSRKRVIGGRLYFDSHLDISEARSTLRSAGQRSGRNSYLPWRGILRLIGYKPPLRREFTELFEGLGEWCYLRPA